MTEVMLKQAGISELSCQFARLMDRLNHHADSLVAISAALLSEAVSQGHVCLNIQRPPVTAITLPPAQEWQQRLQQSEVVGREGEQKPLVLTENGLLYLYRHWQDEQWIAQTIQQRNFELPLENPLHVQQQFAQWQSQLQGTDWQKVAVLMALTQPFCVISGGPGTGKTTIVLRLLQMLQQQDASLQIALAAPTGKAAARLQQAVSQGGLAIAAKTLHRLLKISAHQVNGRYDQTHPLPLDVLIVDEASMIDVSLMARVMRALPQAARLILLGDSRQLASVESGAVLASLCQQSPNFTPAFSQLLNKVTAMNLPEQSVTTTVTPMVNKLVFLQHSYRFDATSMIAQLAEAVNHGDSTATERLLQASSPPVWLQTTQLAAVKAQLLAGYQDYFLAISQEQPAAECLQRFEQYRVLTALKQGPQSVNSINRLIETELQKQGWKTQHRFYPGRPIMITRNDYRQQLYNGDIGLVLYDKRGELKAFFFRDGEEVWLALHQLPAHDTAYAMTIHKSQGSEFDKVCIVLPDEDCPLLSRELLYTAITRARKGLLLLSRPAVLFKTVHNQITRESGLAMALSRAE